MNSFFRHLTAFYQKHPVEIAGGGTLLAVALIIQVGGALAFRNWPQQWAFHQRIRLGRLNHGRREILYWHPYGAWVHVPGIGAAAAQLRDRDSISKQLHDTHLYVLRDSGAYRLATQYSWNGTTREFEFAGRSVRKR